MEAQILNKTTCTSYRGRKTGEPSLYMHRSGKFALNNMSELTDAEYVSFAYVDDKVYLLRSDSTSGFKLRANKTSKDFNSIGLFRAFNKILAVGRNKAIKCATFPIITPSVELTLVDYKTLGFLINTESSILFETEFSPDA